MKARIFILGRDPGAQDKSFDEILQRTFAQVLTDNAAIEHFSSLKDATVSIGKAFSDSDVVMFLSETDRLAETKEILCKALGMNLITDEELLAAALKSASPKELDSAYFNLCHAGVVEGSTVFALKDALYSGFACKRGRQTVVLLPYSEDRTRVLLASRVIPYLNEELGAQIPTAPMQFYYAEQLNLSAARDNVKIALAGTKTAEVFLRYLSYSPDLPGRVITASKAEQRGNTPPNEYVVNLSITAAEFLGLPYGIAMSNAYYVGDDPEGKKTVYIAVTNDAETTVRELHSFYGESTGDFLFRCCAELCKLLSRIIDGDAGLMEKLPAAVQKEKTKKKTNKLKGWIVFVALLIVAAVAAGGWYFHAHGYTLQRWMDRYVNSLPIFQTQRIPDEAPSESETEPTGGIPFLPGPNG